MKTKKGGKGEGAKGRKGEGKMAASNRQQATGRQAKKGEGMKGRKDERKMAASNRQASQEGRKDERTKGRWQQATGNKQQAGKPRRAKG